MIKLIANGEDRGMFLPTSPEEIKTDYIINALKNVHLAEHYIVVAILNRVKLFDFCVSLSQNKNFNISVRTIIGKINSEKSSFAPGQQCIIDRTSIERGNNLSLPVAISSANVSGYLNEHKDLVSDIVKHQYKDEDGTDVANEYVWLLGFKIVPECDIHATIEKGTFADNFIYLKLGDA